MTKLLLDELRCYIDTSNCHNFKMRFIPYTSYISSKISSTFNCLFTPGIHNIQGNRKSDPTRYWVPQLDFPCPIAAYYKTVKSDERRSKWWRRIIGWFTYLRKGITFKSSGTLTSFDGTRTWIICPNFLPTWSRGRGRKHSRIMTITIIWEP